MHRAPLAIKSVSCLIPGFGAAGARFGELIPSRLLLEKITGVGEQASREFVARKLGIESVAATAITAESCREMWAGGLGPREAARLTGRTNACLYDMLAEAMRTALAALQDRGQSPSVKAHIHIVSYPQTMVEYELFRVRRRIGIDSSHLHSLIVQQGCAGLFSALKSARTLLASDECDSNDVVLITAENNMMPYLHQRALGGASFEEIDRWLFPTIFGEGVGAIVVGRASKAPAAEWRIDGFADEFVEREWRVAPQWNDERGVSEIVTRSRAVKQTYLTHVSRLARAAIAECGGAPHVFRLCLHESNPQLVRTVADGIGFPLERVPSISAQVGTLAIVSSFSLLGMATREAAHCVTDQNRLVMVLIGESVGIRAGQLTLSWQGG